MAVSLSEVQLTKLGYSHAVFKAAAPALRDSPFYQTVAYLKLSGGSWFTQAGGMHRDEWVNR